MSKILDPQLDKFDWPPVGSLEFMRQWTFEKGMVIFQTCTQRYGRLSEAAPLSPKSRLVQITLEEPVASPTTILDRAPMHWRNESQQSEYQDDLRIDGMRTS